MASQKTDRLLPQENPNLDPNQKSLSGVSYTQVIQGLSKLYPPSALEERNAASRTDGYWPFIQKGHDPPKQFTYGEFDFSFLAELLDTWLWRWAAFLVVFILMLVVTAVFALLGYLKVRRIRGPQQTIESVKETTAALTPGINKAMGVTPPAPAVTTAQTPATPTPTPSPSPAPTDPSGW